MSGKEQIEKLASLLGYESSNGVLYGIKNDYHFSLYKTKINYVNFYALSIVCTHMLSNETIKTLKKTLKITIEYGSMNDNLIFNALFTSASKPEKSVEQIANIIDTVTLALQDQHINEVNTCLFCGLEKEEEETSWVLYKKLYICAHQLCLENDYEKQEQIIKAEDANLKKLPLSIVLAVIGAFIGTIPAILVMIFTGWLFGILFAVAPICSFFGYKLGKAPMRWYATLIAVISSLVACIVSIFIIYFTLAALSNVDFVELIKDPSSGFMAMFLQAFLFDVIGVLCAWGYITKINHRKVDK